MSTKRTGGLHAQRDPGHGGRSAILPQRSVRHYYNAEAVTTDGHDSYPRAIRDFLMLFGFGWGFFRHHQIGPYGQIIHEARIIPEYAFQTLLTFNAVARAASPNVIGEQQDVSLPQMRALGMKDAQRSR